MLPKIADKLLKSETAAQKLQMDTERLRLLEQYVKEEPEDPFNHYAFALEMAKHDTLKAAALFGHLIAQYPQYIPTYYQAARVMIELQQTTEGVTILEQGIAQATLQNDSKALKEMRALLDDLVD